ncbi:MAG: ECF transporter S component [Clostridium sp.]|nr:ECF transporter S component [Clostridium sp.]
MTTKTAREITLRKLTIKEQTIATVTAIVAAVALPQIFHVIGAVSGLGTALGETFLPMHLPILLVGLIAGPYAGAIAGLFGPLASFALSGMPKVGMLPFMMIELCIYGLCAGLLRNAKMPTICKVLIAQAAGRGIRALAILFAAYVLNQITIPVSVIWTSIVTGLPGLILQWAFLPLLMYWVGNRSREDV